MKIMLIAVDVDVHQLPNEDKMEIELKLKGEDGEGDSALIAFYPNYHLVFSLKINSI